MTKTQVFNVIILDRSGSMECIRKAAVDGFNETLAGIKKAQEKFATYTQEQVDAIFLAAATAADKARIPLARMAVEETGMGVVYHVVLWG